MNDFRNNVKKVMVVFSFLLVALISYIAYFQVFKAPEIAAKTTNKRLWAKRNEVLRGTIYDRDKNALTSGEKTGTLTQSREYIQGDLYVHALGYVNQKYGLTGLEAAYDEELSTYSSVGTGLRSFLRDFDSEELKEAFKTRGKDEPKVGNGLITTLDPAIQKAAYDALGNRKGAAVALNPKTGEVLAMVSKPTYNPNDLDAAMATGENEGIPLINRAVAGLYPPGSTFKPITVASALENIPGVTSRIFKDEGRIVFNDKQSLPNVGGQAHGDINLKTAFQVSSNVVFGTLAMELGNDKLKETAEKFGFNKSIPADGFRIENSRFPTLEKYEKGMIAQSGIGQSSILATPMQMALVASAIANDGIMMQPKLANEVVDMNGNTVKKIGSKKYSQALSAEDANIITDYMVNLVKSNGMSYFNGKNVAGKTGTAENSSGKDHSWFIGFAPANDPEIAVAVIVENGGFGATSAAPVVGSMMNAAFSK
ncbi:peptidoglycan D,D-transpeptidase FtsI family protein [Clostridium paraputrificum]|uniref:peptidoglycan D,D-transpeptidase FtsI family protein n=1 Tax=Clostridium paraputrificum TaxID=29363 RepID=UPI003D34C227